MKRHRAEETIPVLNFKRLTAEFKKVQQVLKDGQDSTLLTCEPVEDNLLEWEVTCRCGEETRLQQSLKELADSMLDPALDRLTLRIRFPVEYPHSPPEVWLKRPRLKSSNGPSASITFGGRICSPLLSSQGWQPSTSMVHVLEVVKSALVDAGVEAEVAVTVRKDYLPNLPSLDRLKTELMPTVNEFCKDGMVAISTEKALPFLGERTTEQEATDRLSLPGSYAQEIYNVDPTQLVLPLVFEVKSALGRKKFCSVFEFFSGLPEDHLILPKWVMNDLFIQEREVVRIRCVSLPLIEFAKFQPHNAEFYQAVRDSGVSVQELLTQGLEGRVSGLSEDSVIPVQIGDSSFDVQVVELRPSGAVRLVDSDMQNSFEFKVDFEPAPNLEDEEAMARYRDRVVEKERCRKAAIVKAREEAESKRRAARQRRLEQLRERAHEIAGGASAGAGEVEVGLKLPDGGQLKLRVQQGVPVAVLKLAALESPWASSSLPWGVYLQSAFPRRVLQDSDLVNSEMHRSTLLLQQEKLPETDEELLSVLGGGCALPPESPPELEVAQVQLPEFDEALVEAKTQRAFEVARWVRAGVAPAEAERRLDAGEILPSVPAPPPLQRHPSVPRPPRPPPRPLQREPSQEEQREALIEQVMNFSGQPRDLAEAVLAANDWNAERAVNMLLG